MEPGKHRRGEDWGPREVIALTIIGASFVLAAIMQILDKPEATIPAWVAAMLAGIGLYYFKNGKGE